MQAIENQNIIQEFHESGAILTGHFILSSGLHSNTYIQCAKALMDAKRAERLCKVLADKIVQQFGPKAFDIIVSPAMGGVIVGYEMGRQLGIPAVFCERVEGNFTLRRGFALQPGAAVLVIEDVLTTGKSSLETFECVREHGGIVKAEACLIDRSNNASLGIPLISLIKLDIQVFSEDNLPDDLRQLPAVKPGSRFIKN